ncbi:hypothetical protein BOTBODRAFT_169335 [Botryobasidium botryosum FD-172 SS1]|uniref:SET domain-containing protein n=1 Tax=Botryobasidium botryosum (strain FD-172 SS1) TaxID=930990 RepID=A0A067N0W8_BOTB1|nr:hypothetical protein BOTBODRAFT_169335 [Botryobasidium botryosum FD-172 SS1]
MNRTATTVLTVATVGLVAYAVYFDYKRRNDASFRKKLRKERKRATKGAKAQSEVGEDASAASDLKAALRVIRAEPVPPTTEEKERFFMEQVGMGEQLSARGPAFVIPAAMCFYRALRVYPSPVELIMIYQKTVPEPIFKIVMELTNLDVSEPEPSVRESLVVEEEEAKSEHPTGPPSEASSQEWDNVTDPGPTSTPPDSNVHYPFPFIVVERAEGYYESFPPASMHVKVEKVPLNDPGAPLVNDRPVLRQVLVATKDFNAGDEIYIEHPIVTALDSDLEGKGTHCSYCLRDIQSSSVVKIADDLLSTAYCSEDCQLQSEAHWHSLLFGSSTPVPGAQPLTAEAQAKRKAAQEKFADYIKTHEHVSPLLIARFVARMITEESAKMSSPEKPLPASKLPEPSENALEYGFYDHVERLRFLEVTSTPAEEEETKVLRDVLLTALEGLEEFVHDERYLVLKGKILYNAIGVYFDDGRDDKPTPTTRPEDVERTRTPKGTPRQVGTAFYRVTSYIYHSCTPNVRPSFSSGNAELHLIANRSIKKGEQLTMAFVDVDQKPETTLVDSRRARRQELARGWRFACECERCVEEAAEIAKAPPSEEKEAEKQKDEVVEQEIKEELLQGGAKEEEVVAKFENRDAQPQTEVPVQAEGQEAVVEPEVRGAVREKEEKLKGIVQEVVKEEEEAQKEIGPLDDATAGKAVPGPDSLLQAEEAPKPVVEAGLEDAMEGAKDEEKEEEFAEETDTDTPPGGSVTDSYEHIDHIPVTESHILEMQKGVSEVKSTNDDAYLGGENFDVVLVNQILNEFEKEHGIDLSDDRMAIQRIREAAEKARVELPSTSQIEIDLPFITADASGPKHIKFKMSLSQFEALVAN